MLNAILAFGSIWYVIFVTGSAAYGVYAGALGIYNFIDLLVRSEIRNHLLKFNPDEDRNIYSSAFTALGMVSVVVSAFGLLILLLPDLLPAIILSYEPALLVMILCLPVTVTSEIPRSALEYQSRFKTIALDEFTSNIIQYSIVLLWTFYLEDWKGLLYGWLCYQLVLTGLTWARSGLHVSFRYQKEEWTKLYHHGYALSSQNLVQRAKGLVNPFIVGYFLGTQGVGIVSFAEKIVQGLSFFREALYRVSASTIGKLKPDAPEIGSLM